jgi:hypothetical protein
MQPIRLLTLLMLQLPTHLQMTLLLTTSYNLNNQRQYTRLALVFQVPC